MREKYRLMRDSQHTAEIMAKSLAVAERLTNLDVYKEAEWVFPYVNYGSEVETVTLIEMSLKQGKKVAVPLLINPRENKMVFQQIDELKNLNKVHYGIMEPERDDSRFVEPTEKTLIIVPGLAFDVNGYRLGYGGGYYDRFLSENNSIKTICVCFDRCISSSLSKEEYDVAVDMCVTESRIIGGETDAGR